MLRRSLRLALCGVILCLPISSFAQDKDPEEYRKFFKAPETPLEFWNALQFEVDVGRYDLAAKLLEGLMKKKPTDADLLRIIDKDGILAILKLRTMPWPDKQRAQAKKDLELLITQATAANNKRLGDPVRIRKFIDELSATPEERAHAMRELYKTGSVAIPVMVDRLLKTKDTGERLALLQALARMGPSSIAPLIAALDCNDTQTKLDILDILRKRHLRYAKQIAPHLWYFTAAKTQPEAVRKRAREVLSDFLDIPASRLIPAKVALTREAERYYRHEIVFGDPREVRIWRWDGKGVVLGWPPAVSTVTASQAEEYYGLRYARQALNLDPAYRPAQVVMLSLAIEKAIERGGISAPLSRSAPEVAELLAKSNPELVIEILDRAMKEKRSGVVLAAVQSLGSRAEVRAKRPTAGSEPALVRALYYPDPRVQMAAAQALIAIPGKPAPKTAARIVEILGRALTPMVGLARPGRKVLVAVGDEGWRDSVKQAVADAGSTPVAVANGREAMRELRARADIDLVLLDSTLPMPGLAPLMAQLRADVDVARIPILLAAVPTTRASHDAAVRYKKVKQRLDAINEETARYRATLAAIDKEEFEERQAVEKTKFASADEKASALEKVQEKFDVQRRAADKEDPLAVKVVKEIPRLQTELDALAKRYDLESRVRESALARWSSRYANVEVVHASLLTDARGLESSLVTKVREAGVALPPLEQKQAAELAIRTLESLALSRPAGYDVKIVTATILEALRSGRLSPDGQLAAINICSKLPGAKTQDVLSRVILDPARTLGNRIAATKALVQNIQRFSIQMTETQFSPLRELSVAPTVDLKLKEQLDILLGSLRPGDRTTGVQLRTYKPSPAPVIPPPKEK